MTPAEQNAARLIDEGNALEDDARLEDALQRYEEAIRLAPTLARGHLNRGNLLLAVGDTQGALDAFATALAQDPAYASAHYNMGNVYVRSGRPQEALAAYRKAIAAKPEFADAEVAQGVVLEGLGQTEAAVGSYRRALALNPQYAEVHASLGNALRALGQNADAAASYRRALEMDPDLHDVRGNLGNALWNLGKLNDAVTSYRQVLGVNPDDAKAHLNLGIVLQELGQLDEAVASYRRVLQLRPEYSDVYGNLLFCLSHNEAISSEALFAEHCGFGARFELPLVANWPQHPNSRDTERRVRIGFVSGDLRAHPIAYFIEPVLAHLAGSSLLSMDAYYNHSVEDGVTKRMRGYFRHWHAVSSLSDEALAQKIGGDGIDILIDLSGHTGGNRLLSFARKPAPIQVSWMGYPGTTGLAAMDYYIADRHFLPPGAFDDQFTERIVYLPASAPFLPDTRAPAINILPALSKGHVTFGSFNRVSKLTRSAIALWSRVLRALPDARMLLGGMPQEGGYDVLLGWFAEEGIAHERLTFRPRCGIGAYLEMHHQVDMCLDTVPYAGGTTTNHALWMGVPTLTLAGPTVPGRQGAALLGHVGLEAFVAKDAADFEAKGVHWAGDLDALARVRAGLRQRCEKSPIRDPAAIAAGLERALRMMWQRWCAGLPPETIDVSEIAMAKV